MGSGSSQSVATGGAGSEISPFPSPVDEKPPPAPAAAASATANLTSKRVRLTPDDQMRRMRRRERNKIAATKCRNKKKARTVNLVKESEILDSQNKALKIEITKLETEKDRLMGILQQHEPSCAKKTKRSHESPASIRRL